MPDVASQATIADARQNRSLIGRQQRAWRYYGLPKENTHSSGDVDGMSAAIGEVRYVVGWMAEQMSRLRWLVTINGEDSWSVVTPDGEEISTADVDDDGEAFEDQAAASQQLLRIVGWDDETVRQITTNLFVAGALDYVADPGPGGSDQPDPDMWQVVSTIRPDREKILKRALFSVKGLWPHAADPNEPDAPLFGVLDVCATIEWLSKLSWSQSANRVAMNGWLAVADGLEFGDGGDFYVRMNQITRAIMRDPMMGASPAVLRGAKELTEPGAGGGPKGMSYLIPNRPYDATIDRRLQHAIQRLAYGLPIPPEILLGMTATNRAVAYQVEESSYRAHVEPPAQLVSRVAEGALAKVLPSVGEILVEPDPTLLLARRHSVADVKDGWQMGLIGARFAREVLGVPEDAAPTQEDLVLLAFIRSLTGQVPREQDPASRAGNEAVQASVFLHPLVGRSGAPNGDGAGRPEAVSAASAVEGDLDDLGRTLAEVDFQVRSELNGAAAMAVERARDRIGAAARSRRDLRDEIPSDVPNGEVAATVGMQLLRDVGVDVDQVVADAMEPLADWWTGRLGTAQESLTALFGQGADAPVVEPDWDETDLTASRDMLVSGLIAQTIGQAEQKHPPGPDPDLLRSVMAVAGGEHDGAIVAALTPAGWTPTPAAPGGLGVGVKTMQALKDNGIVHTGWRWLWRPGVLGGEFEPHRSLGGTFHPLDGIPTPTGYAPGMPNAPCMCDLQPVLRRASGVFAPQQVAAGA